MLRAMLYVAATLMPCMGAMQEELAVLSNNHGSALKKLGDVDRAMQMFALALQVTPDSQPRPRKHARTHARTHTSVCASAYIHILP
jgi:Tfp pilus assembly protein PilF